jgi:hypothetical protein
MKCYLLDKGVYDLKDCIRLYADILMICSSLSAWVLIILERDKH